MAEPMTMLVEVWPVAADQAGLWLLGDDAIRTYPGQAHPLAVQADSDPHSEVELLLGELHAYEVWLHSTSWRTDGPRVIITYLAAIDAGDLVLDRYPDARPIHLALAEAAGPPATHGPTERPRAERWDVLLHALRHAAWLVDGHDATTRAALGELWVRHLRGLEPALAEMYSTPHVA